MFRRFKPRNITHYTVISDIWPYKEKGQDGRATTTSGDNYERPSLCPEIGQETKGASLLAGTNNVEGLLGESGDCWTEDPLLLSFESKMLPSCSTFLVGLLILWDSEALLVAMHTSRFQPFRLTQVAVLATNPLDLQLTVHSLDCGLTVLEELAIKHTSILQLGVNLYCPSK